MNKVLSSPTTLQEIIQIAPEWEAVLRSLADEGKLGAHELFNRLGPQAIYRKALGLNEERGRFLILLRDNYFQPYLSKMLGSNQNLRRFWSQRRLDSGQQKQNILSFSIDLAQKMEGVLIKQLNQIAEDGYKVLLPAYIQRSVHNAIVDYIRQEWAWERNTLQDMQLDGEQEDPRQNVPDDVSYSPEQQALSAEQVTQLNQLRQELEHMLSDSQYPREPFVVLDCLFGLGLTEHSVVGQEMTMRECCDRLKIGGETQARRIARCQVLLDKGLDLVRQRIRDKLPGVVETWQGELNVNVASRRELSQQLGMTESEVERLVKSRQYTSLKELAERGVVKPNRLPEIAKKGAVAAFVPIDVNSATARDMMDIFGISKELAQRLVSERPFAELSDLSARNLMDKAALEQIRKRGAVVRIKAADERRIDLNRAELKDAVEAGLPQAVAELALKGRPFLTWSELEDYLGCDSPTWVILRQKFCLGLTSG